MTASTLQNAFMILKAEGWALGLGFLSSVLLYLSFFPADLGFLGWIAMVPILYVMRSNVQLRIKLLSASVCGLCFFIPALQWMRLDKHEVHRPFR